METPPRRKPGFFSRLFTAKGADAAAADAPLNEDPNIALPYSTDAAPVERVDEPIEAEVAEKKGGGLFGWFRRKKVEDEQEAEARLAETELAIPSAAPAEPRRSWFARLFEKLGRTRRNLLDRVRSILGLSGRLDEDTIEQIEDALIQNDVSIETTQKIIAKMKAEVRRRGEDNVTGEALLDVFKESVRDILSNSAPGFEPAAPDNGPYVVLVVGVNGVGKTTTIAKMAQRCTRAGLSTMLVAGDTFRAAAVEQLEIWAGRTGCDFVRAADNSDAAALCYDALSRARARNTQVVFIDTAGRLHTKSSLMDELGKIRRVLEKQQAGAPHETLLVLDATTGQNALQQVKVFKEAVPLTGLVMTKLDGTAKGGILLSVLDQHKVPITLIGVGERADDLRDFDPDQYAAALFGEEK